MALRYKTRKRWALAVLVLGLPAYISLSWWLVSLFERPSILVELAIYVTLGVLWVFPLKAIFKGVGQSDPDADNEDTSG